MTRKRKRIIVSVIVASALIAFYFSLPQKLFDDPYSTVLEDKDGRLLAASIAQDGQWRFPEKKSVNEKFRAAIITFEDKRFENHLGVDPFAIARALRQNLRKRKVVSGGSTISMQVIRLSRKGQSRTFFEKVLELVMATRLELKYSKAEILSIYASHAPFGGNVVGIESACWRYFGRSAAELSWSEAALLAVLPNNPSLIHPGKNVYRLKEKRDHLLAKLKDAGKFDQLTLELAIEEPIPVNPLPLPRYAHHLLDRIAKEGHAQTRLTSTIDLHLQERTEQIIADHHQRLKGNQIFNAAAIIIDVKTGNVLSYVGNTEAGSAYEDNVDVVASRRSTGSILKPFLFAAMVDEGKMLSKTLMPDVPTNINGFSPRNFSHEFDGAVPADKALIRSLNIPAVYELREFRYEKFYEVLQNVGITTLGKPADHYGLSLVLGGAEGTLWDITGAYASMARTLVNYSGHPGSNRYDRNDFHAPRYDTTVVITMPELEENSFLSAASIWLTFETLKEVYRPGEEAGWKYFNSSKKIAWKTGTSFGFRDGWAVGVTTDYAVGVWVGNADGEGRPGLVGSETAAPIMFDLFSLLPTQPWFQQPVTEMEQFDVCLKSGQRASDICNEKALLWSTKKGLQTGLCTYHKKIHLTPDEKFQVHSGCVDLDQMRSKSWFVLPPVQEYYFKSRNVSYRVLPPFRKDCEDPSVNLAMDLIYPKPNAKIYVPHELDGTIGNTIFEVAHRSPAVTIFWHLDGVYIGSTHKSHHLPFAPAKGSHVLTLVDEYGESLERSFLVL